MNDEKLKKEIRLIKAVGEILNLAENPLKEEYYKDDQPLAIMDCANIVMLIAPKVESN